jgi:hypothetical protein
MTDEELLAKMREQYQYATLESHILQDGVLYLRCHVCLVKPVPIYGSVLWCDDCIDEFFEDKRGVMTDFIERKRKQSGQDTQANE